MRIIVAGSRDWTDAALIERVLSQAAFSCPIELVITGGCEIGADAIAVKWAKSSGTPYCIVPALWDTEGRAAGPKRNERMASMFGAKYLYAFNKDNSHGTRSMIDCAKRHLITIAVYNEIDGVFSVETELNMTDLNQFIASMPVDN